MATATTSVVAEEESYNPIYSPIRVKPVMVNEHLDGYLFLSRPLFGPLIFNNTDSDARDHCANERTFLSWLRLSIYMSVVSVAIIMSFHLANKPTQMEKRIALPLGLIFWLLAVACLVSGFANYIQTVTKYSRRRALVQSGWKMQLIFTIVATAIVAACVLFLSTNARRAR